MSDEFKEGDRLLPTWSYWPDKRRGPWLLQLHWQVLDGRAECVGVELRSVYWPEVNDHERKGSYWLRRALGRTPSRGRVATASLIRALPLGRLIEEDRQALGESMPGSLGQTYVASKSLRNRARLDEATRVYQAAWSDGRPPTKAVAEHFTISHSAAAKLVARARAVGLLPTTSPGRPMGPVDRTTQEGKD